MRFRGQSFLRVGKGGKKVWLGGSLKGRAHLNLTFEKKLDSHAMVLEGNGGEL